MSPAPAPPLPATVTSRRVALDVLEAVLRHRRPLDEALEAVRGLAGLETRDRGFVHLIVAETLRRLGRIDALIDHCLERPLAAKAVRIRDVLRLGVCQLVFIGTPAHAAVDTSVALAADIHSGAYKSLVNAVLRRLVREAATGDGGTGLQALAAGRDPVRADVPDWLWASWEAAYGPEDARRIAAASLVEAPLDLSLRGGDGDAETWAGLLGAERLPTGSLRRPLAAGGGSVAELPGYDEGAWWVQDAAAALPARLLGATGPGSLAGRTMADLCAAPGGKAAQLAAAGARVYAVDRSARRLVRLTRNLARLGLTAETLVANAAGWVPPEPVDGVLVDAPCTATGTIRRHPDVLFLKTPADIGRLVTAQDRLLAAAAGMLRPGGVLVYCVCSLQPQEGRERIAAALAAGLPLVRRPVHPDEVGGLAELITGEGDLRTLPFHLAEQGGMDAFYAARLVRV